MNKVQEKLKDCIEKQTLKSLDRLSEALDTTANDAADNDNQMDEAGASSPPAIDASETTTGKGENKVMVSKRSKRKQKHSYRMKAIQKKKSAAAAAEKPKPKPRYHCAF